MSADLSRQASTERLASPEQLDQIIALRTGGLWTVLIAVLLVCVAAGVWAIGRPVTATVVTTGVFITVAEAHRQVLIASIPSSFTRDVRVGAKARVFLSTQDGGADSDVVHGRVASVARASGAISEIRVEIDPAVATDRTALHAIAPGALARVEMDSVARAPVSFLLPGLKRPLGVRDED